MCLKIDQKRIFAVLSLQRDFILVFDLRMQQDLAPGRQTKIHHRDGRTNDEFFPLAPSNASEPSKQADGGQGMFGLKAFGIQTRLDIDTVHSHALRNTKITPLNFN